MRHSFLGILSLAAGCVPPATQPTAYGGPQPAAGQPGAQPGTAGPATAPAGDLSRISFEAPAGWTVTRDAGSFTVVATRCAFQVFAPFATEAALDATLDAVFWQQLPGYALMNGPTYDTVAEGIAAAGWRYRRVEAWLSYTADSNKS